MLSLLQLLPGVQPKGESKQLTLGAPGSTAEPRGGGCLGYQRIWCENGAEVWCENGRRGQARGLSEVTKSWGQTKRGRRCSEVLGVSALQMEVLPCAGQVSLPPLLAALLPSPSQTRALGDVFPGPKHPSLPPALPVRACLGTPEADFLTWG